MKVKNRLALQFTLLFAVLLFIALSGIYLFIQQYRSRFFFNKLDERAITIAQFYLAEDNLSATKFKQVLHKFPQSLSEESIRIYNDHLEPEFIPEDSIKWPKPFLEQIRQEKIVHLVLGSKQVTGIYYSDNSGDFLFVVAAVDVSGLQSMQELRLIMIIVFIVLLIITFFIGRVFAKISLSPIVKIRDNLRTIRATDLHTRLKVNSRETDEIDSLSLSINQLLEHLEQSFESQKSFVANSSHELRTPLTSILGQAETTLTKDRSPVEYKATLRAIIESVIQLNHIIKSLMELVETNIDTKDFQSIRADELAWEIADEFMINYGEQQLEVIYDFRGDPSKLIIYGNRRLLFIAISNILKNALKFSEGKRVKYIISSSPTAIIMEIKDKGMGIAADDLAKIFQPFYRSQNALSFPGNGIGLSMSQNIIRLHNASINVYSEINQGTTFLLSFPING